MQMLKMKKIEIFGEEPKTLEDHLKDIQDPSLRHQLESINSRFKNLKNEIESVSASAEQFQEFLTHFKKS
jgi:hypothetical protein